ncbi:MAG: Mut7-C RNAse domain-containing protein [Anaerolineae bacterium]
MMEEHKSGREVPKLLADGTLGKLARWLRVLGYDTRYVQGDVARVAYEARKDGRILLTQDRALTRRRGLVVVLVTAESLEEQLTQIVAVVGPMPEGTLPRCMDCNERLQQVPVKVAQAHVPAYIARTHKVFHRCPECGKIYWRGSHWKDIEGLIDQALARSE